MSKLIIQQDVEIAEILTGFETKNSYSINDEQGNKLMYAFEESGFFNAQFLGGHRHLKLNILDENKNALLSIDRPFYFFKSKVDVLLPDGELFGKIQQTKFIGTRSFDFIDTQGNLLFTCVSKIPHIWTFNIFQNEQQIAQILKKWVGTGIEVFTDADNFLIDLQDIQDDSLKYAVIAMAFIVDLTCFERKS